MQIDEKTLKSQVEMAQNMSDDQLRNLGRMQGMDFDPAMMRQSMNMMKNMSPEQIKSMAETAKRMQESGQFPRGSGGFPGSGPKQSAPAYEPPREVTRSLPELEEVKVLKECGNIKFKEGKCEEAEKLYRDSILKLEEVRHLVRPVDKEEARSLETSILLNLSNIKAMNKEFDSLLDLAKEIVLISPSSGKGYYRYAQALFHLGKADAALEKIRTARQLSSFSEIDELRKSILIKLGRTEEAEEEEVIKEDRPVQKKASSYEQKTPSTGFMPPMNPATLPDLSKIDDGQLDMMKNMMNNESGRKMMRDMFKSQYGMDMSEDQLNMMSGMMNKETLKMAAEQMKAGGMNVPPGMHRPYQPTAREDTPIDRSVGQGVATEESTGPQDMSGSLKGMRPGEAPGMEALVQNKGMIKMMVEMIKTNPAMLRGICGSLGESHPVSKFIANRSDDDLKRYAVWIGRGSSLLFFCYPAFAFLRKHIAAVGFLLVAFIVYKYIL